MTEPLDIIIIGAGPGGLAAALLARQNRLSCRLMEKGQNILQGIIDSQQFTVKRL
ncbi:MAG: FAD-binding protein [Pseudomonadota bacterium]